jgi:hypothetical protein
MIVTMFSKANFGLSFQIQLRRQLSTRAFVSLAEAIGLSPGIVKRGHTCIVMHL